MKGNVISAARTDAKVAEIVARIERLPLTAWQINARIVVGVATFFDAFDFLTIAFVLPVLIPAWHIKPSNVGFLISAGALGQLIGAIFFGRLAERIGRLRTTILTILVYGVFSFFCAVSWSYTSLLIFRIIQGFGLGGEVPIAASYINEIAKAKNRGRFFLLYEMVFPAGLLIAAFAGYWIVPHLGWRWLFVVGSPVAALAIYMRWRLPESPRWLASVGRYEEAEKAMVFIERNVKQAYGADLPEPEKIKPVGAVAGKRTRFVELFSPVYLRRTLIVWSIWFSAYLAGYGITTWLPSLYRTVFKLPLDKALLYGTITQIGALIASFAAAMLVDKVGRRTLIGTVMVIGGLFQLLLWYTGASTAFRVLVLATFGHSFISAAAFTIYLYTPELYPTRMRALGTSIASSWLRIAVMLGPVITGFVVARYTVSWAFLVFAGVVILAGVVTLLFGVETKGKVLEEVSP